MLTKYRDIEKNLLHQDKLDKDALVSNNYMTKVVEELAKSSPKFNEISRYSISHKIFKKFNKI